jgi:hypothetical protein
MESISSPQTVYSDLSGISSPQNAYRSIHSDVYGSIFSVDFHLYLGGMLIGSDLQVDDVSLHVAAIS